MRTTALIKRTTWPNRLAFNSNEPEPLDIFMMAIPLALVAAVLGEEGYFGRVGNGHTSAESEPHRARERGLYFRSHLDLFTWTSLPAAEPACLPWGLLLPETNVSAVTTQSYLSLGSQSVSQCTQECWCGGRSLVLPA